MQPLGAVDKALNFQFSFLFSRWVMKCSNVGHESTLRDLTSMKMMWIRRYGLYGHQLSTQLNTYGKFWSDVPDVPLPSKHPVHPSSSPHTGRIYDKEHWSCSRASWLDNTLLRLSMMVFPFICHQFVYCILNPMIYAIQTAWFCGWTRIQTELVSQSSQRVLSRCGLKETKQ